MNIRVTKRGTYLRTTIVPVTSIFRFDGKMKVLDRKIFQEGATYSELVALEENARRIRRNRK